MIKKRFFIVAVNLLLMSTQALAGQDNLLSEKLMRFEQWNMQWLARTQQESPQALAAFTTDGCSGGLSDGWKLLSSSVPAFRQRWGKRPPWEACCVAHDRIYWQGATDAGYQKRWQADWQLRQCVIDIGKQQSAQLALRYQLSSQETEKYFFMAAESMFRAVRMGGQPCSWLPWRWGYGWPYCGIKTLASNKISLVK